MRLYGKERVKRLGGEPLGAESLESLCDDRWNLGPDDDVRFLVGDGAWYFTRTACESAAAKPAPSGCATRLAETISGEQPQLQPLSVAYKRLRSVSVLTEENGELECKRWRFKRRGSRRYLERRMMTAEGWMVSFYEVLPITAADNVDMSSDPGLRDSTTGEMSAAGNMASYAVKALSKDLVLVDLKPWFVSGRKCNDLLELSTRSSASRERGPSSK